MPLSYSLSRSQNDALVIDTELAKSTAVGREVLSTEVTAASLLVNQPSPDGSLQEWANFVRVNNMFGGEQAAARMDELCQKHTSNDAGKQDLLVKLLTILRQHESLNPLADVVTGESGIRTFRLFTLLSGAKTPDKKRLLNTILLVFGRNHVQKKYRSLNLDDLSKKDLADAEYQPNVVTLHHKQLFAIFNANGIALKQHDFKNYPDSYDTMWANRFAKASKERDDYGTRPNRAAVDTETDGKIRTAVEEKRFNPQGNYDDNLLLLNFRMIYDLQFRSGQEVRVLYRFVPTPPPF